MNSAAPESGPAPQLSIIIPMMNEAGNVLPLTRELVAAMATGPDYELIFIDDGSSDGTVAEIREALDLAPSALLLIHPKQAGKAAALYNGFRRARGAWIQTIDGDMQQDPADIVRVWNAHVAPGAPADLGLISGARNSRHDGTVKWLSSRIANGVRRAMLDDDVKDVGCAFKLMRREAALDMPNFGGMHRFVAALIKRAGWRVIEVTVTDRPRHMGKSKYGTLGRLAVGIADLLGVMWLRMRATFSPVAETDDRR